MTAPNSQQPLADVYLQQRDALARFFRARSGARPDVEDLLQDLYLKVLKVDPATEVRDPRAFLYRLASNLLLDARRSSQRSAARDGAWRYLARTDGDGVDVDDAPSAETVVTHRDRLSKLLKALDHLPAKTAAIFRMHKFDDLSYAEIAERLAISRSSVEKHMMDALRILAAKAPK